jgi:hypothetical protein
LLYLGQVAIVNENLLYHVVGVLCCRRDMCTAQNRWLHKEGKLCRKIEATSQDISQEVKAWSQWVFQMDNEVVAKWLNDNKVKVLEWSSQSLDLNPIENVWAEMKKLVRGRRPTNLTRLHKLCQEG